MQELRVTRAMYPNWNAESERRDEGAMSWPLDEIPMPDRWPNDGPWPVGTCWRVDLSKLDHLKVLHPHWSAVSPAVQSSGRAFVWVLVLPSKQGVTLWSPDLVYGGESWSLAGAESSATLTAQPSINVVDDYHGWLQNGVLTDDCEGRTYE